MSGGPIIQVNLGADGKPFEVELGANTHPAITALPAPTDQMAIRDGRETQPYVASELLCVEI
jgi:hypothetical protein